MAKKALVRATVVAFPASALEAETPSGESVTRKAASLKDILGFDPRPESSKPFSSENKSAEEADRAEIKVSALPREERMKRALNESRDRERLRRCWDMTHVLGQSSDQDIVLHPATLQDTV